MHIATTWMLAGSGLTLAAPGGAETFQTGQVVYATPSEAWNDWRAGCVIGPGRSNSSYQVKCPGTSEYLWIAEQYISTTPPQPKPDPLRPGNMLVPQIRPANAAAPKPVLASQWPTPRTQTRTPAASAGATGAPPSGRYGCRYGYSNMGFMDIQGRSYRGIDLKPSGAFHPFTVGAGGVMGFAAGLGGFGQVAKRVGQAIYRGPTGALNMPWFTIQFVTPGGASDRLDCILQTG